MKRIINKFKKNVPISEQQDNPNYPYLNKSFWYKLLNTNNEC